MKTSTAKANAVDMMDNADALTTCPAHPTDARLMHRAITKLVRFAKRNRVPLRQSYLRLAKRAAIMVGRHTHVISSSAPGASAFFRETQKCPRT
jgi:hypothetical protein